MTKEACLALAAAQYDELRAIGQESDFYTLEGQFNQLWTALGHSVLEQTLGPVPANKPRKNSVQTRIGRVAIANANPFSAPVLGSRTRSYLQAKLVLLAAERVFAHVPPLVESLLGMRVSTTQVYRCTQAAAQVLPAAAPDAPCPGVSTGTRPVYSMVDGPMRFTDTGWQEVKVGRVCQHSAPASAPVGKTGPSQYMAQRGPVATFTQRFERVLPPAAHGVRPLHCCAR